MPITVEKRHNEPVLIVTMTGRVTADETRALVKECAQLTDGMQETIYRITDVNSAEIPLMDMMAIVGVVNSNVPGSAKDPRICGIFVGKSKTSRLYRDIMQQHVYEGRELPLFATMDDALSFIHSQQNRISA